MQKISSRDNAKLKLAKKVRDGRSEELIFIEGTRLAEEMLRSEITVNEVLIAEYFSRKLQNTGLIESLELKTGLINEVADKLFSSISDTQNSQGIILFCDKPSTSKDNFEKNFSDIQNKLPIIVMLHEINNPSNLGAILRTAEAVNIAGIIISKNSSDVFSPKSLRASMGAAVRLNIWTNADFDEVLHWAVEKNLISTAADINTETTYENIDWQKPRLLVFGSEAHGLSAQEFGKIRESLRIPMENSVESLNLAISCGVILFEAKRQFNKRNTF